MPVVIVATMTATPDSVDAVRAALQDAVAAVHGEPGCELYALHQTGETFVMVEQWADAHALTVHGSAPALAKLHDQLDGLLAAELSVLTLTPLPGGDPAKGTLRT